MKITFDLQSRLPEEFAGEFQAEALQELLGPIRTVGARLEVEYDDWPKALAKLVELIGNDLVRGIQMTIEKDRYPE